MQQVTKKQSLYILTLWCLLWWLLLSIYAYAPRNSLVNAEHLHWNMGNFFDDSMTVTALAHFSEDGLLKTYGLENRGNTLTSGKFDVVCANGSGANAQLIDRDGIQKTIGSWQKDCLYLHSPPLHFWIWHGLLKLCNNNFRAFKIFVCFLSCLTLFPLFFFLSLYFKRSHALFAIIIYSSSIAFWGWGNALYNQSIQFLFFYSFLAIPRKAKLLNQMAILSLAFLIGMTSYELVIPVIAYELLSFKRCRHHIFNLLSTFMGLFFAFILMTGLKALYLSSFMLALKDYFSSVRYLYPVPGGLYQWFSIAFSMLGKNLIDQWDTLTLIIPLFFVVGLFQIIRSKEEGTYKRYWILIKILLVMLSIAVIFPKNLYYHTHTLHRLLHLPFIIATAILLSINLGSSKFHSLLKPLFIFICLSLSVPRITQLLKLLPALYRPIPANEITYNYSDFSEEINYQNTRGVIDRNERLRYSGEKLRLVDGLYDRHQFPPLILDSNAIYSFDWIYPHLFPLKEVVLMTGINDQELITQSCKILLWGVQLSEEHYKVSSHQDEADLSAITFSFNAPLIRGIRLQCNAQDTLFIDEIRVFSAD